MTTTTIPNKKRLGVLWLCIIVGFLTLVVRVLWLQVLDGAELQEKASDQWLTTTTLEAERGKILDTNGKELAVSSDATSIMLQPQRLSYRRAQQEAAAAMATLLPIDATQVLASATQSSTLPTPYSLEEVASAFSNVTHMQAEVIAVQLQPYTGDQVVAAMTGVSGGLSAEIVYDESSRKRKVSQTAEEVAAELAPLLGMDQQVILDKILDNQDKSEVWLKRQVDASVADAVRRKHLTGVKLVTETKRYYPQCEMASQVIGMTNVDGDGLTGLELEYDELMQGEDGKILAETDTRQEELAFGTKELIAPVDGNDVSLTIDSTIQYYVEREMELAVQKNLPAGGVRVIVMDPQTGAILAMGAKPDVDLNNLPREDAEALNAGLRNGLVVDAYEPGSTFKIVTLTSALSEKLVDLNTTFSCSGSYVVDGVTIKCHKTGGHGTQTLVEAVENSCNVAFMQMAEKLGAEKFYNYLENFGFGQKTGVDYPGESTGILIDESKVKMPDLARIGFGQSISVTPIQLLTAACAGVNGGTLYKPYLVDRVTDAEGNVISQTQPTVVRSVVNQETSDLVGSILESVVSSGSGSLAYIAGHHVGGKTGTAQKYDSETGLIKEGANIASFIGFAPMDDPKIAVLFLVDEPQDVSSTFGSVVAAPHVKAIIEDTLEYWGVQPDYAVADENRTQVTVPDVRGLALADALSQLQKAGLQCSETVNGFVTSQMPQAGTTVYTGTEVLLEIDAVGAAASPDATAQAVLATDTTQSTPQAPQETGTAEQMPGAAATQAVSPVEGAGAANLSQTQATGPPGD